MKLFEFPSGRLMACFLILTSELEIKKDKEVIDVETGRDSLFATVELLEIRFWQSDGLYRNQLEGYRPKRTIKMCSQSS